MQSSATALTGMSPLWARTTLLRTAMILWPVSFQRTYQPSVGLTALISVARDQEVDIPTQLDTGVRLLQAQSHMNGDDLHFCHTSMCLYLSSQG